MERWTKDGIKHHFYQVEGGHVDLEDDLGGETGQGGITKSLLDRYEGLWPKYNFTGDMTAVPYALSMEVFDLEFWDKAYLDEIIKINPQLADAIYGWAINSGTSRPVEVLQKHINALNLKGTRYDNIVADGVFGDRTLTALHAYLTTCSGRDPIDKLVKSIVFGQWTFYLNITTSRKNEANETFIAGWMNRVSHKLDSYREFM